MKPFAFVCVCNYDRVALGLMNPLQATPRTIFSLARTWASATRARASANAVWATPDQLATSGTVTEMKTVRVLVFSVHLSRFTSIIAAYFFLLM